MKRHPLRQPRLYDGRIQFAAEDENRGNEIQKHQRDDDRGKPRIHRHVVAGKARQILAENDARDQRRHHREDDARQDLQKTSPAAGQPGMQDNQRHNHRRDGDAVAGEKQKAFVGFDEERNVAARGFQDQGTEHDQERHQERRDGGDQGISDRFQPQPIPRPRLDHRIGPVQRDPQRLDAIGGEIDRQHHADGQNAAARRGQYIVYFVRQCVRDLLRPGLQHQPHGAVGELLGTEKAGQRRQYDQEREQRHQRRQRDVARDRPAVIGEERIGRLHHDEVDVANEPHILPRSGHAIRSQSLG